MILKRGKKCNARHAQILNVVAYIIISVAASAAPIFADVYPPFRFALRGATHFLGFRQEKSQVSFYGK